MQQLKVFTHDALRHTFSLTLILGWYRNLTCTVCKFCVSVSATSDWPGNTNDYDRRPTNIRKCDTSKFLQPCQTFRKHPRQQGKSKLRLTYFSNSGSIEFAIKYAATRLRSLRFVYTGVSPLCVYACTRERVVFHRNSSNHASPGTLPAHRPHRPHRPKSRPKCDGRKYWLQQKPTMIHMLFMAWSFVTDCGHQQWTHLTARMNHMFGAVYASMRLVCSNCRSHLVCKNIIMIFPLWKEGYAHIFGYRIQKHSNIYVRLIPKCGRVYSLSPIHHFFVNHFHLALLQSQASASNEDDGFDLSIIW
jgi:hypothetical protein